MNTRLISPVTDNIDKQRTYREQMGRYKRAMQEGFYFEAMLISYATIEDRLFSMLYHMAFRKNRKTLDPLKQQTLIIFRSLRHIKHMTRTHPWDSNTLPAK